jgi:predicted RNA binding protein YcfA (HicA-like mRNA interferase family)
MGKYAIRERVIEVLESHGFERVPRKASGHLSYQKAAHRVTVPHKLHDRGMALKILRHQAGLMDAHL